MPKINVVKSIVIAAPRDQIFADVRDFRRWRTWSPWLIVEPETEVTFAEDGRRYAWDGQITGAGEMEIVNEASPRSIDYKLTFLKPWKSRAAVRFAFDEKDEGTQVTWTMESSLPFFMFFLKGMMERFIGMDYERGLNMLKESLETGSVSSRIERVGAGTFPGCQYLGIRAQCPLPDVGPSMGADFKKLRSILAEEGIQASGSPFSICHQWDVAKGLVDYTVAVPVASGADKSLDGVVAGEMDACEVYIVKHTGAYRYLGNAWAAGMMFRRAKMFRMNRKGSPFEVYENDPDKVPERELVTLLHFPVK